MAAFSDKRLRKTWKIAESADPALITRLSQELRLHPLVTRILLRRGQHSPEAIQQFLQPRLADFRDPQQLRHLPEATAAILQAMRQQKRLIILGDYDVDGITATAIMLSFFQDCGYPHVDYFIPNRFEHGYGLTSASAAVLREMKPDLVITVDNGITATEEVRQLQASGIQTIITDHHLPDSTSLPPGIVVNPNHPACSYPFKGISGCGVALKVVVSLRKALRELGWWSEARPEPNLKAYLDFAALGTVADMVPLVDENRLIVHHGLEVMRHKLRPGLAAMADLRDWGALDTEAISFHFGPLLNAAGRMKEASLALRVLMSSTEHEARALVQTLAQANEDRRTKGSEMFEIALKHLQTLPPRQSLIVASHAFHEGIIGIVATRLVERFYKPALVFAKNGEYYKGSARSIPELHLREALAECGDFLTKFGGHAAAAGCQIHESRFEAFTAHFESVCQAKLRQVPQPSLTLEALLEPNQIDSGLVEQLQRLQPFGMNNPPPLFVVSSPNQSFQTMKDKHIKWSVEGGHEIVGWNLAKPFFEKRPERLAVTLGFNEFRGQRRIQLLIQEYQ